MRSMHQPTLEAPAWPELERAFAAAVATLERNIVPGRTPDEPPYFIRAGGGYSEPWTRDAAINTLQAGALLCPEVARDTLAMVCEQGLDPQRGLIARDDQWWDSIIWVSGAWRYYLVTGDADFLAAAFAIGTRSLDVLREAHFDPQRGLFEGPAVMQDGITGYPDPYLDTARMGYSFVLDHPGTDRMACLSTNVVHLRAHRELLAMAEELCRLGRRRADAPATAGLARDRDDLAEMIERQLWNPERGTYDFLVHADGRREESQEGLGLALAMLELGDGGRAAQVLAATHRQPRGLVNLWPHVQGYDDARPGRHNALLWPMVMGFWAQAVARTRDAQELARRSTTSSRCSPGAGSSSSRRTTP